MPTKAAQHIIIALGILICFPAIAHASEWADTFGTAAITTYLPEDSAKVLVIAPGGGDEELDELSRTLTAAIDNVQGTTSVRIAALDRQDAPDKEFLENAQTVGADTVLIIRLFESGETATAVGTFYRPDGDAFSAFAVERGDRLKARETAPKQNEEPEPPPEEPKADPDATSPGKGVTPEAADAIESVTVTEPADVESKVATYHSELLRVEKRKDRLTFYRSVRDEKITEEEFLRALDRDEFLERYKTKKRRKRVVASVAILGLVGSGLVAVGTGASDDVGSGVTGVAAGVMVLSAGVVVGAALIDPFPLSYDEAQRAVYEHNGELREELGIPPEVETMSSKAPPIELDAGIGSVGNGAGLMVRGRF